GFLQRLLSREGFLAEGGARERRSRRVSGLEAVEPDHREDEERCRRGHRDPREPALLRLRRLALPLGLHLLGRDGPRDRGKKMRALPRLPECRRRLLHLFPDPERLAAVRALRGVGLEGQHGLFPLRESLFELPADGSVHARAPAWAAPRKSFL